jgi:hypothetical protein
LLQVNKIAKAIEAFKQLGQMNRYLISTKTWNGLCWQGAINGYSAEVLGFCEKAVNTATAEQVWL